MLLIIKKLIWVKHFLLTISIKSSPFPIKEEMTVMLTVELWLISHKMQTAGHNYYFSGKVLCKSLQGSKRYQIKVYSVRGILSYLSIFGTYESMRFSRQWCILENPCGNSDTEQLLWKYSIMQPLSIYLSLYCPITIISECHRILTCIMPLWSVNSLILEVGNKR